MAESDKECQQTTQFIKESKSTNLPAVEISAGFRSYGKFQAVQNLNLNVPTSAM